MKFSWSKEQDRQNQAVRLEIIDLVKSVNLRIIL